MTEMRHNRQVMFVLECLLQFLVFFTLMVIVCFEPLGFAIADMWRCFMVMVPVVAAHVIRNNVQGNGKFYFFHILLLAMAVIFARDENEGFFYFIVVAVLVGYSSFVRFRATSQLKECPPLYFLVVMLAAYASGKGYGTPIVSEVSVAVSALYVPCYLVYQNVARLDRVFEENRDTANFPRRQLSLVNQYIMVLAVAGILVAMGIGLFVGGGSFGFIAVPLKALARGIAYLIIGFIVLLGKFQKNGDYSDTDMSGGDEGEEFGGMGLAMPDGDLQKWINAAIIVAAILIIAVLVVLLIRALNNVMKSRMCMAVNGDKAEFIRDGDRVEALRPGRAGRPRGMSGRASANQRFRRLYRSMILKNVRKNGLKSPDPSMVPSELTRSYLKGDDGRLEAITQYYQKARYSREEVDEAAIQALKGADK